jgi:hypothetical protein
MLIIATIWAPWQHVMRDIAREITPGTAIAKAAFNKKGDPFGSRLENFTFSAHSTVFRILFTFD